MCEMVMSLAWIKCYHISMSPLYSFITQLWSPTVLLSRHRSSRDWPQAPFNSTSKHVPPPTNTDWLQHLSCGGSIARRPSANTKCSETTGDIRSSDLIQDRRVTSRPSPSHSPVLIVHYHSLSTLLLYKPRNYTRGTFIMRVF